MAYGRMAPRGYGRKVARRRVGGVRRRRIVRRRLPVRRALNPTPTFVETFRQPDVIELTPGAGIGQAFKVRISDIPQIVQYYNLYKQYRINWVKVMLIPKLLTIQGDPNAASYNATGPTATWYGNIRIVSAIQDSPDVQVPANEDEVLKMNGCKIQSFKSMWSKSFKAVPDVAMGNAAGNPVYTKQRYRQFFNFDTVTSGNNPEHGAVCAYLTMPGAVVGSAPIKQTFWVYYKVNFTLRDPQ